MQSVEKSERAKKESGARFELSKEVILFLDVTQKMEKIIKMLKLEMLFGSEGKTRNLKH